MRKLILVSFSAFIGYLLAAVLLMPRPAVRAGVGAGTPSGNGDVNGDGAIDIADAVYTLLYLFKGGPEPVACADPQELMGRVAALEDTNRLLADSLCRERTDRFVDNGDGTITDRCTGLMWAQKPGDINGDGALNDRVQHDVAVAYCTGLDLAGHAGWRLPSFRELEDLIHSRGYGLGNISWIPPVDPLFGLPQGGYWSASADLVNRDRFWVVDFYGAGPTGLINHTSQQVDQQSFALAVRGP